MLKPIYCYKDTPLKGVWKTEGKEEYVFITLHTETNSCPHRRKISVIYVPHSDSTVFLDLNMLYYVYNTAFPHSS